MKNVIYPLAMAWGVYSLGVEAKEKQPNIVFIMADDLGWTDLSIMGSDYYETPHIDRLASQGILFTNAYASAALSPATLEIKPCDNGPVPFLSSPKCHFPTCPH